MKFQIKEAEFRYAANLCAEVWLVSQKAEAENAPNPSVTTESDMAVLKFDAENPEPFYKESRRIAAKHQAEQAEQRADAFKKRFTPGNNILCRLGGTKRGKIFEMFVLGQSPDQAHVKLQDEAGNVFWKEAQDVEVVSVLGNSGTDDFDFLIKRVAEKFNIPPEYSQAYLDELARARERVESAAKIGLRFREDERTVDRLVCHTQINTPDNKGGYLFPNTSRKEVDELFKSMGIENIDEYLRGMERWDEKEPPKHIKVARKNGKTEFLAALDATRQESNAEAILNCLKNIERLLETQKTPEMTPCKRFVAGEDLKPGECVYVSTDGAIMKS